MAKDNSSRLDQIFEALNRLRPQQSDQPAQTPSAPVVAASYLIVGLGNPGREYARTRHNIGFMLVDRLAEQLGLTFSRTQSKALICDGYYQNRRLYLAKPQTFMNASGNAVQALLKFYKLPLEHLLVAYDEVDLPFGSLRIKPSGGSAGHKGMRSIIQQLGSQEFARLRLGIGRPPGQRLAANYVLKPFSATQEPELELFLDKASQAALAIISAGIDQAMTEYNRTEG